VSTIIETKTFTAKASKVWTQKHYEDFVLFIASNPSAGEVVPNSGGVRKVRWAKAASGKSGGVRVIYFNTAFKVTWLLTLDGKMNVKPFPLMS
jgi:hypothetical protein